MAYRTGEIVGPSIPPVVAFQPIPDAETGAESEGPNDITFAPPGFPPGLNAGLFVGFHGKFFLGGIDNEENPLVYVDLDTGSYFHFIDTVQREVGHLDGLLATKRNLFVADISPAGHLDGTAANTGVIYQIHSLSSTAVLEEQTETTPQDFALLQNYPNPFNSSTVIRFALPQTQNVELAVYNVAGQKVATLIDGARNAGSYSIQWDGRDDNGQALASGLYLYRLRAEDIVETRKLVLLK